MTPRYWACLVALLAAPVVQAQTTPLPAWEPDDSGYEDSGAHDDAGYEEEDVPTAPYAPPELPEENPPNRPFSGAVWASGHWYWDGEEWRYNAGTWLAPMPGYRFINGYWEQDSQGWRWVSGGWARLDSTMVEIPVAITGGEALATSRPPPPPREERAPPAPEPGLTWTPGYWYWTGVEHVWVEGTWAAPPRPGLVFVAPRWVRRGPSWFFSCGGWATRGSAQVTIPVYRHAGIRVSWQHPQYFSHAWRRYPVVRHYEYRGWGNGGWGRDGGYRVRDSRWREPRHYRHPASPGGQHRGRGRYRD
jgi:hypothetical protein